MKKRLGGVKGAITVAMSWAVVWGLPAFVIEGLANVGVELPITYTIDMWPQTLVMPGLLCSLLFSGVLAVAAGRRGIEDFPVASLSALGAVIGLVPGGVAVVKLTGDAFPILGVIGATALLGAAAGAASALLFRYLTRRHVPEGAAA
jgi:hypothetical protein